MHAFYEERNQETEIFIEKVSHHPPHIHHAIEMIYIKKGALALGIGQDFYPMEAGSFAVVFPELIHHYQVFDPDGCEAIFLLASPAVSGKFLTVLQNSIPENPVIDEKILHPDIEYALESLLKENTEEYEKAIWNAFIQIILARCFKEYNFTDKNAMDDGDMVYQTVLYLAKHYTEHLSQADMAKELGYSPYVLSKVFSNVFHTNFNQYLNNLRLDHAEGQLEHTDLSITDIWLNAGFDSQRTFNRVFRNRYHMSPREFRDSTRQ